MTVNAGTASFPGSALLLPCGHPYRTDHTRKQQARLSKLALAMVVSASSTWQADLAVSQAYLDLICSLSGKVTAAAAFIVQSSGTDDHELT